MGQMENLPRNVAALIYKKQYWRTPAFDKVAQIEPILAEELFDTGVNIGTSTAIGLLQRAHYVRLAEARPAQEAFLYG